MLSFSKLTIRYFKNLFLILHNRISVSVCMGQIVSDALAEDFPDFVGRSFFLKTARVFLWVTLERAVT